MVRPVDIDGAAHLVLTDAVIPLHPEEAVFDAMLLEPTVHVLLRKTRRRSPSGVRARWPFSWRG